MQPRGCPQAARGPGRSTRGAGTGGGGLGSALTGTLKAKASAIFRGAHLQPLLAARPWGTSPLLARHQGAVAERQCLQPKSEHPRGQAPWEEQDRARPQSRRQDGGRAWSLEAGEGGSLEGRRKGGSRPSETYSCCLVLLHTLVLRLGLTAQCLERSKCSVNAWQRNRLGVAGG